MLTKLKLTGAARPDGVAQLAALKTVANPGLSVSAVCVSRKEPVGAVIDRRESVDHIDQRGVR